jgi:YgiT-type zinc finger domain-containing protein
MEKPFDKCPVCGGELDEKEVERLIRGGDDTAIVRVQAEVCRQCGERLYSEDVVRQFKDVRRLLVKHQTAGFKEVGKTFEVA